MSGGDPKRLLEQPGALHPRLRELLQSGKDELPNAERLARIAERLGPKLTAQPTASGAVVRVPDAAGWLVPLSLALAGAVSLALLRVQAPVLESQTGIASGSEPRGLAEVGIASTPPESQPEGNAAAATFAGDARASAALTSLPDGDPVANRRSSTRQAARPTRPIVVDDPLGELTLLDEAQNALNSSPALALERAELHAARYPRGDYIQEREVIAVDALLRLGKRRAAERRAQRFLAHFPGSSHRSRVERLQAEAASLHESH